MPYRSMHTIGFLLAFVSVSAWAHSSADDCSALLWAQNRKMTAAIELIKLKPDEFQAVHSSDPSREIETLSQANLQRLLTSLNERMPIHDPDSIAQKQIAGLVAKADFAALRPLQGVSGDMQLPADDFYSHLVGGSRTVSFQWVGTVKSASLQNFAGHVPRDSARVSLTLGRTTGFVLPQFSSAAGMIQFFQEWDPDLIADVVKYNRYNLPVSAWNVSAFLEFLNPTRLQEIFPSHALYQRLSPLRRQLHKYLLTVDDAQTFFSALLYHYLSRSVDIGDQTVEQLQNEWDRMGGAAQLFKDAQASIGWEGSNLHIPLNVPASQYLIVRQAETVVRALADHSDRMRFRRSQRIDYKSMPDAPLNLR